MSSRVVVVGGSIAGLMAAIVLKRLGHDVTVYERIPATMLHDRGAGMGAFSETLQFLAKHDLTKTEVGCPSSYRYWMDRNGKEVSRMDMPSDKTTSWDLIHAILRANFDGLKSKQVPNPPKEDVRGRYEYGYRAERVAPKDGSRALDVYLKGDDGKELKVEADMVICADGAGGPLRKYLLQDIGGERSYTGYIAWRGTVPESALTQQARESMVNKVTFHHQPGLQIVGYVIPGATGSVKPGERRMNWLWYANVKEGSEEWREVMTDVNGVLRTYSIPHGKVRPKMWEKQLAEGKEKLPPVVVELMHKTTTPFIQAITDNFSPQVTFFDGKVLLMGDSVAGFRPHVAASMSQSAFQAQLLERLVGESKGTLGKSQVKEFEQEVLKYAKEWSDRGIQMGNLSQFGPHPMQRMSS